MSDRSSTAIILVAGEPAGVNELVSGGQRATQDLIDRLFLHLFEEQPDFREGPPTFAPQLAESWEWSPDRRRLDLSLRRGVRWNDGREVNAGDVRFSWQAQTHPAVGWRYAHLKQAIEEVEIVDSHRLSVHFAHRYPGQLADLNEGVILPRHAWGALPFARWPSDARWFLDHLVTNGPYRLGEWEPQQHVVLERNEHYFETGLPKIERLVLRVTPLRHNRLHGLTAGSADFIEQLSASEARELADNPEVVVRRAWHRQYDYIAWNLRDDAFADVDTRVALTLGLDREELVSALWKGEARVAVSPILTSVWAYDPTIQPWPHAPDEASRRLLDAGWRRQEGSWHRGDGPLAFELLVNTANPIHVDAALLAKEQWARLGILVDVRRLDFHALVERLDRGDFAAAIGSWGIDTTLDVGYAFHSRSIRDGYNSGGYSNPEVDRRIDALREITDLDERRRELSELQRLIHEDQPYTFLWEPPRFDAHSARLRGARPNALSALFRAREWWIQPD